MHHSSHGRVPRSASFTPLSQTGCVPHPELYTSLNYSAFTPRPEELRVFVPCRARRDRLATFCRVPTCTHVHTAHAASDPHLSPPRPTSPYLQRTRAHMRAGTNLCCTSSRCGISTSSRAARRALTSVVSCPQNLGEKRLPKTILGARMLSTHQVAICRAPHLQKGST